MSVFVQQQHTVCDFSGSDSWVILSPIEQSIKRKIESVGTPLKDWDINIYRGVLTGCNDAFIISTDKRNEILSHTADYVEGQAEDAYSPAGEYARTAALIRPILRGRDIKRYGYNWANLYLIATFPSRHYDIEQYPAVKNYLLSEFGMERLEQTGRTHIVNGKQIKSRKRTNNKWFETQDSISYWDDFNQPKICWASVGATEYSYIPEEYLLLDTNYFFATNEPLDKLGLLNSKLIIWWINTEDTPIGNGGAYRHYKYNIERLSLPVIDCHLQTFITDILINKDISLNQHHIDDIVYHLYGLTDEEIAYIESL